MRRTGIIVFLVLVLSLLCASFLLRAAGAGGWTILGWNNLGMHCMDSDYTVFSILPPYNTIQAQLIDATGHLVRNGSQVRVTYEALSDPSGSINTTSANKTLFWQQILNLFGVSLPVDSGLAGKNMPGAGNVPQLMTFDNNLAWFIAEGIPLTPNDDNGLKNYYPMMHLVARDNQGKILATTDIVLPVSDEMDCRACHSSGSPTIAKPTSGWVFDNNPERDYRLNILLLHDQMNGSSSTYHSALTASGYNPAGLYTTVVEGGKSILCARCHSSNALAGTGVAGIAPLTQAMHGYHSGVIDPLTGQTLDGTANRSACYRCHPGSRTRCLRGAMGNAVAADGSMAIQCQDCHGSMSSVGASNRQGWLNEPNCQNCHTGMADSNNGQIRYTSVFTATGSPRVPANQTFATSPNTPAAGISLYRFSTGHGGLQCSACHHSTHAEYPSSHLNDNIQALQLQNHVGMISECATCHNTTPDTITGGPHGMHPVGQGWASNHESAVEGGGSSACKACHGVDYRGTVLSRALGDRTVSTKFGSKQLWRGFQIGCYTCHNGPGSEDANPNNAPVVRDVTISAASGVSTTFPLQASSPSGLPLQFRVVSQPSLGTVAINGASATYFSFQGSAGVDFFTFAASDGSLDSNLGTIHLNVSQTFLIPFYQAGPSSYTGIAVTNYSRGVANLRFTAFGADGSLLALPKNPADFTLQAQTQLAKLGSEIFGVGTPQTQSGWVQVTSDNLNVGCFFQYGSSLQLDGSLAQTQIAKRFRFTRVLEGQSVFRGQTATTYLSIANPTAGPITLSLNLNGSQSGQVLAPSQARTIAPHGLLFGSVSDLFGVNNPVSGAFVDVQVNSGDGAVGFELVDFPGSQTVLGLNAALNSGGSLDAYSAQLAVNDSYFTNLKLINIGTASRTVTLRAMADTGSSLAPAVNLTLAAGESIEQDLSQLLSLGAQATAIGSLIVSADGQGVLGDVIFGDPARMNFAASLPLQTQKFSQAVFNHVANASGYFTGLALLNPNQQSTSITVEVFSETGVKAGTYTTSLSSNSRFSRLLTELVPGSVGQMRGFVVLRSTYPVIAQQLFGDGAMEFLSAVPPTMIQ